VALRDEQRNRPTCITLYIHIMLLLFRLFSVIFCENVNFSNKKPRKFLSVFLFFLLSSIWYTKIFCNFKQKNILVRAYLCQRFVFSLKIEWSVDYTLKLVQHSLIIGSLALDRACSDPIVRLIVIHHVEIQPSMN